jgi:3',5'-cyclic AMP phosphodiesterase CpdA
MTVLLHASDPHFGTERALPVAALETLVREQRPLVLLLSGDITQRATTSQFYKARAFVDRLAVPVTLAIPGNHDIPLFNLAARLFQPYRRYAEAFGTELEPEFENDDIIVIALNSTRRYRHVDGTLSSTQIERVGSRLKGATAHQWRMVMLHHPVAVTRTQDRHNLLRGHERAVRSWAAAGVDLIAGGHIHLPFVLPLRERWPQLPHAMWAVQAGTAVSSRIRAEAENSVNLIRTGASALAAERRVGDPRRCVVERWDFRPATGRFALAHTQSLCAEEVA